MTNFLVDICTKISHSLDTGKEILILQVRNWFYLESCVLCCVLVAQLCLTLCGPVDCNLPGSSVPGDSPGKNWSGLPFPSLGDLPNPGIKPGSPALQVGSLLSESPGKPVYL